MNRLHPRFTKVLLISNKLCPFQAYVSFQRVQIIQNPIVRFFLVGVLGVLRLQTVM